VPGDRLRTLTNGWQPVRWIGRRHLGSLSLALAPYLRPIRIRAGAFGRGRPHRDLIVSPQHRLYLEGPTIELLFAARGVLVAASHLVDDQKVMRASDLDEVTYHHVLLDRHEVIRANGLPTESLRLGEVALSALGKEAREEIARVTGHAAAGSGPGIAAAPILHRHEALALGGMAP